MFDKTRMRPFLVAAGLALLSSCTCKVAKVQRQLVGQGNVGCWSVVATIQHGDTLHFDHKHILLFSRKGRFDHQFWRGESYGEYKPRKSASDTIPIPTCGYRNFPDTWSWSLEDATHLVLNGSTTTIVRMTRDTLVLSNFDVCMSCDQMIYVRKTDLSDVDPDVLKVIP